MKRFLLLLLIVCCLLTGCQAKPQPAANHVDTAPFITVNGETLTFKEYYAIESAYLAQYEAAGVDLSDEKVVAYLQDLATTYAAEQMLVKQDMRAQGCYDFTEEEDAWFVQMGQDAYNTALEDVKSSLRSPDMSEDDVLVYALSYAKSLGVTEETYVDYYRTQYAAARYHEWLTKDQPITDADVQSAYDTRVADSKVLYENDVAAFETAVYNNLEVWYRPAGYRSVLQILLPAEGDTEEAKLQSVQATLDDIYARLQNGESFQTLIALYGTDANFADESFLSTGYQVHADSILWDADFVSAAFSADMAQPGSWSQPFASTLGVHILYYLGDVTGGPIELTADLRTALSSLLYTERYTAAQTERINELAAAATVVFH